MKEKCRLHMMESNEKVMVNGRFRSSHLPHPIVQIERGMRIIAADGTEVGMVGAVMVHPQREDITHILLCRVPVTAVCGQTAVYRLIPIHLIAKINDETIHLNIQCDDLDKLAAHKPA